MKKIIDKTSLGLFCIIYMLLAFGSWCLITISYQNKFFFLLAGILNLALMYVLKQLINRIRIKSELFSQMKTVLIVIIGVTSILAVSLFINAFSIVDYYIAGMSLLWGIWAIILVIRSCEVDFKQIGTGIKSLIREHSLLLLLLGIIIFLSYEETGYQFKWDGLLYYQSCKEATLSSVSSLALYGHLSQTYAAYVTLLRHLLGNVEMAMIIGNIILLIIAVVSYCALIQVLIPNKNKCFYVLSTAILAFSPYYLGMVNYFSLDYCLMCLFPAVLYFTFKEQWVYQMIVAILFCFTKETAIIIYGGLCAGIIIYDFIKWKKSNLSIKEIIMKMLATQHYYSMAISGILWIVLFFLLGPWNAGDSSLALDVSYIINKLQILYVFQFNWIFSVIIVIYITILVVIRKKIAINKYILALALSQFVFTLFSCIFRTINHPRYIDSSVVVLYALGIYCLSKILKEKWQRVISLLLASVLCIASYSSIDFISNKLFERIDIGEGEIIKTNRVPFGDGSIYNKQMLWMEQAMNYAVEAALSDNDIIVIPALAERTYAFDGMSEMKDVKGMYCIEQQYWNPIKRRREVNKQVGNEEYLIYHISEEANIRIIPNNKKNNISFIYVDTDMGYDIDAVLDNANIIEEQEYSYRGWTMKRVVIKDI